MSTENLANEAASTDLAKVHHKSATSMRASSQGKFSIFTVRANQKIYSDLVSEADARKSYIESLEALLAEHNIPLPERPITRSRYTK
jgi:hypothetical protein